MLESNNCEHLILGSILLKLIGNWAVHVMEMADCKNGNVDEEMLCKCLANMGSYWLNGFHSQ